MPTQPPQDFNQFINLIMTGLSKLIDLIGPFWPIIAFLIKIWIYIVYFIPVLGMKFLKYLGLWPNIWPFN
jgi:hypothetical protein